MLALGYKRLGCGAAGAGAAHALRLHKLCSQESAFALQWTYKCKRGHTNLDIQITKVDIQMPLPCGLQTLRLPLYVHFCFASPDSFIYCVHNTAFTLPSRCFHSTFIPSDGPAVIRRCRAGGVRVRADASWAAALPKRGFAAFP